jgi:type IV secretory pathway protease TraF
MPLKRLKWQLIPLLALLGITAAFVFVVSAVRINTTPSLPRGLYQLRPVDDAPIDYGDLVTFCLPAVNPYTALAKDRE